ncbi:sortase domain-bontaining protein [Streptomyces sp. NPDC020731]|uniref:sortase domain-containing protein n=1 Tax=Streptomyces sp. NPDC020731 TaxID=3365085 RepID=UPI0037BA2E27
MGSPRNTLRTGFPSGNGRLPAGVAWVVLLLGLWLWGGERSDVPAGMSGAAAGDMAAAGRPPRTELPPAHRPLAAAVPQRLDIPALGVHVPVVADGHGRPGAVRWYADGVTPGEPGTALMAGSAALHPVDALGPGRKIRVARADTGAAEFTVEDVRVLARERFDARRAAGPRHEGRAELRLVACGEEPDRVTGGCTADAIVSAYLTGTGP